MSEEIIIEVGKNFIIESLDALIDVARKNPQQKERVIKLTEEIAKQVNNLENDNQITKDFITRVIEVLDEAVTDILRTGAPKGDRRRLLKIKIGCESIKEGEVLASRAEMRRYRISFINSLKDRINLVTDEEKK